MTLYRNRTVERTLAIIEALATSKGSATLQTISARTGLDPSTAFRFLAILCVHHYAHKDPITKRYSAGSKLFAVGSRPLAVATIVRQARPFLVRLAAITGETVHIGILEGTQARYYRSVTAATHPAKLISPGTRIDAHACAIGKALLACLPTEDLVDRYRDTPLRPRTKRTIRSFGTLQREIRAGQARGYATDAEECETGVAAVAVPLPSPNPESRINHAIEVAAPTTRMTKGRLTAIVRQAKRTAVEIHSYMAETGRS